MRISLRRCSFAALLVLLLVSGLAAAPPTAPGRGQPGGGAFCYGTDWILLYQAPTGWTLDNSQLGPDNSGCAVVYPNGGSWADSPTVMYGQPGRERSDVGSRKGAMAVDTRSVLRQAPGTRITHGPDLTAGDGHELKTLYMRGPEGWSSELVAFMDGRRQFPMFVLSTREEGGLDRALPAFRELLATVVFQNTTPERISEQLGGRGMVPSPYDRPPSEGGRR